MEWGEYESAVVPSEGSSTRIQMYLNAGRDYEAWKSDFVSDLYAVRRERGGRGRERGELWAPTC